MSLWEVRWLHGSFSKFSVKQFESSVSLGSETSHSEHFSRSVIAIFIEMQVSSVCLSVTCSIYVRSSQEIFRLQRRCALLLIFWVVEWNAYVLRSLGYCYSHHISRLTIAMAEDESEAGSGNTEDDSQAVGLRLDLHCIILMLSLESPCRGQDCPDLVSMEECHWWRLCCFMRPAFLPTWCSIVVRTVWLCVSVLIVHYNFYMHLYVREYMCEWFSEPVPEFVRDARKADELKWRLDGGANLKFAFLCGLKTNKQKKKPISKSFGFTSMTFRLDKPLIHFYISMTRRIPRHPAMLVSGVQVGR